MQLCGLARLGDKLDARYWGLYRFEGMFVTDYGGYEVHVVGSYVSARRRGTDRTRLVGLGLSAQLDPSDMDIWWQS